MIHRLGGTDMDNSLIEYIVQEFRNQSSIDIRNDTAADDENTGRSRKSENRTIECSNYGNKSSVFGL